MSSERITELHEQASEHYLNGDYDGALHAWRDVLRLDPSNEQALDGVRMASQFVERPQPPVETAPEVERELDQGLKVLDSLGGTATDLGATMVLDRGMVDGMIDRKPAPEGTAGSPDSDPARQREGIDFGDLSTVEPYGLEPAPSPTPPRSTPGVAALELKRRVGDLLAEARSKAEAGDRDEALTILSRLAILDEDNAEADALREALQAAGSSDLDKVEQAIIEGVAALESDRLDDAERWFREALAVSPEHREAQHYLQKVEEGRSGTRAAAGTHDGGEDLLGGDLLAGAHAPRGEAPPSEDAVPLATASSPAPGKLRPASRPPKAAPLSEDEPPPSRPHRVLLTPTRVLFGGLGAVALVCGVMALPHLLARPAAKAPAPAPPQRTARPATTIVPSSSPTVPAVSSDPAARAKAVAAGIAKGRAQTAAGDFAAAVVSFNQALQIDPGSLEAKAGLNEAGEGYKARKAERESLDRIRLAFRDEEYTSALRLAYRLPPSVPKSYVDGVKVAGWYNLAIVALRSGDCKEALSHLDEALSIVPSDADAKALRAFSVRYVDAPKDRAFLDQVEALPFKPVPAS